MFKGNLNYLKLYKRVFNCDPIAGRGINNRISCCSLNAFSNHFASPLTFCSDSKSSLTSPPQPLPSPSPSSSSPPKYGKSKSTKTASSSGPVGGQKSAFNWKSLSIAGSVLGIVWAGVHLFKSYKKKQIERTHLRSIGKPSIGGPFDLIDQNGNPFTSKDLLGKWVILYFGFTHCPDVCPEELEKIVQVVEKIDKRRGPGSLVPVFISVDPDRDTPEAVKAYLKDFSPKFIGLTGDKRAIDSVSKRYRVYYSAGPKDKDSDYIVDHTIIMYLIDPEGQFCTYFGQNKTSDLIFEEIDTEMIKKSGSSWW